MSESETQSAPTPAPAPTSAPGLMMAFGEFAASLRPRPVPLTRNGAPVLFRGRQVMHAMPGHPDEVWLKLIKIRYGSEKHTQADWLALIDAARDEPAHPTVMGG